MTEIINSGFDLLDGLTVDEALSDPHFIPELLLEELNGEEIQKAFFRDITVNSNVVGFRESLPQYLDEDVQRVAEYGEIPVGDPVGGELKTKAIEKLGVGIRVSWEQRNDNDMDAVARELRARKNTIIRSQARDAIAAFDEAGLEELAVGTAWDQQGSDPAGDFLDAMELIMGAETEDGRYYEYTPDVLMINPVTLNLLKRNEQVQKLYIGNMAAENPLFKGISAEPLIFGGVQIVKSHYVPKGTAYLGQQQTAGFMAQREAPQVTDFYAERGESRLGGSNMSFRSDYVHRRAFAIDAPKSVVKLTELVTG